ncbi:DUF5134 domain-containing protein [Streptomyces sp. NPDC048506]|uniref:DUF5134 domain-containing protein n=1 Tax=Streptomyces sp. NPDC048506 TaxID=3155028 RepID=UPI0034142066
MHQPLLAGWLLVLLCAGAGAYCLARARTGPAAHRAELRGEGLMALGMAAMALPASVVAPPAWSPWLFTAVFGAAGLWALARRHLHHAVGAWAMVYMALVMALPAGGMDHSGPMGAMAHAASPVGVPLLTGLLLAYFTVYVIVTGVRLAPATGAVADGVGPSGAGSNGLGAGAGAEPVGLLRACRVAMGIGMLAMLLAM